MNSGMTPGKALAWTLVLALTASFAFWTLASGFVRDVYRYWFIYLLYVSVFAPLSWFTYRGYRKGTDNGLFANAPRSQRRGMSIVCAFVWILLAATQIVRAWLGRPDDILFRLACASFYLVGSADSWRRFVELKAPPTSFPQ